VIASTSVAVQTAVVVLGGAGLLGLVLLLSRQGRLSLRYALGWIGVSTLVIVSALLLGVAGGISTSLPFTPTGLIAAVGLAFVLLITLQLSISLSGHQEAIRDLSEANALLEERLQRMEQRAELPQDAP
jgi:hypothetical protein